MTIKNVKSNRVNTLTADNLTQSARSLARFEIDNTNLRFILITVVALSGEDPFKCIHTGLFTQSIYEMFISVLQICEP